MIRSSRPPIYAAVHPSGEDSVYLGQALDDIIMWDESSFSSLDSLKKEFEARRADVHKHTACRQRLDYDIIISSRFEDSFLTEHTLDPAEEVDGSNWREKGHFKKPIEISDSQSADEPWSDKHVSSSLSDIKNTRAKRRSVSVSTSQ